ncbi:bifunctional AP-4-A phosphorylase/ADP sulfurylase [Elasticomyces elasticus]|nr:bifunctional AP-4-A phosphorylase/ADP sulfurylase [Elasticomyces elasticus]
MQFGLEASLCALVKSKFSTAKASQALIFSFTELSVLRPNSDTPFQLRYCPALSEKPKNNSDDPSKDSESEEKKKFDPFENPVGDLVIAHVPRTKPSHVLVLNKYPVIPQHFILATKKNKAQTHVLEEEDLAATYACLKEWEASRDGSFIDAKDKRRLFAFFNSGEHSGASQAHRHIQFLPVEEMARAQKKDDEGWRPLIDSMLESRHTLEFDNKRLLYSPSIPFTHFAVPIPPSPLSDTLFNLYKLLHEAASASVRAHIASSPGDLSLHPTEGGASPISYNLALTTSGMAICPRRREAGMLRDAEGAEVGDVALNGTILAGTLMVKAEDEWDLLRGDRGLAELDKLLQGIGIPQRVSEKGEDRLRL